MNFLENKLDDSGDQQALQSMLGIKIKYFSGN